MNTLEKYRALGTLLQADVCDQKSAIAESSKKPHNRGFVSYSDTEVSDDPFCRLAAFKHGRDDEI